MLRQVLDAVFAQAPRLAPKKLGGIVGCLCLCLCLCHGHDAIDPVLARVVAQRVIIAAEAGRIDGAQLACAVAAVQLLQRGLLREPDPREAAAGLAKIARMASLEVDLARREARLDTLNEEIQALEKAQPARPEEEPLRGLMLSFLETLRSAGKAREALSQPNQGKAGLREK